jgi:hypothetical protein
MYQPFLPSTVLGGDSGGPIAAAAASTMLDQDGPRKRRKGVTDTFPVRLHGLLLDMDLEGTGDIIAWTPSGKSFRVHKPDEFVRDIGPKYFRQKNFASFKRQLNVYGFDRVLGSDDGGAFYHPLFRRDSPELCRSLRRREDL